MERFKKVLIASVLLSGLLIVSLFLWFVMSSQSPPYRRVPLFYWEFEDYPSKLVANRSQVRFHDYHTTIASLKRASVDYHKEVFLGLKLTGFHYNPSSKVGNYTLPETLIIARLDILVDLSDETLKIEELNLSCEFDKSLGEDVWSSLYDPSDYFAYNLQLIQATKGNVSPFEPFITWKGVENSQIASVIAGLPIHFTSYNNSINHEFILTLTLVYSSSSSMKNYLSTSLYITIKDKK